MLPGEPLCGFSGLTAFGGDWSIGMAELTATFWVGAVPVPGVTISLWFAAFGIKV